MKKNKILFQLTGSIACYKACSIISKLVQNGFETQAVCTENALKFIGMATLEGLTHRPVYATGFEEKSGIGHIELSKWLDLAIICPATANIINKLASGIADDYVSTIFLSFDFSKPYLIAPAMNRNMLIHPATQKSIKTLKRWGINVLGTGKGYQACGDTGEGRLLEPEEIYKEIIKNLK
ncbi:MAG: flavoprotein [Elusimicrobia bacterium]|nr:flavoprotein [Elusimicrobiota bacterium]